MAETVQTDDFSPFVVSRWLGSTIRAEEDELLVPDVVDYWRHHKFRVI